MAYPNNKRAPGAQPGNQNARKSKATEKRVSVSVSLSGAQLREVLDQLAVIGLTPTDENIRAQFRENVRKRV